MTIESQKAIADELLKRVESLDPFCIVAGGAPRDWYMGNEANDIDLYFHLPMHWTLGLIEIKLKELFHDVLKIDHVTFNHTWKYETMKDIKHIFNIEFQGLKVQLIHMMKPTFSCVVDKFSTTICQAWYKHRQIRTTFDFDIALAANAIVINDKEGYTMENAHVKKMIERFKSYSVMSKDRAAYFALYTLIQKEKHDN